MEFTQTQNACAYINGQFILTQPLRLTAPTANKSIINTLRRGITGHDIYCGTTLTKEFMKIIFFCKSTA